MTEGPALCPGPSVGRRHRDCDHPRHGHGENYYSFVKASTLRRAVPTRRAFREPSQDRQGFFRKDYDRSTSAPPSSPPFRQGHHPSVESPDQNQARFQGDKPGFRCANFVMDFLTKHSTTISTSTPRRRRFLPEENRRGTRRSARPFRVSRKRRRETAKRCRSQPQTARLQDSPHHKSELAERSMIFYHRRAIRRRVPSPSRDVRTQAVFSLRGHRSMLRAHQEVVYETGVQPLATALKHRGGDRQPGVTKIVVSPPMRCRPACTSGCSLPRSSSSSFPTSSAEAPLYLQTPLFRVVTRRRPFCYSEEERLKRSSSAVANAEITRFKVWRDFARRVPRIHRRGDAARPGAHHQGRPHPRPAGSSTLGKNTFERQGFIIDNLRIEEDLVEQGTWLFRNS